MTTTFAEYSAAAEARKDIAAAVLGHTYALCEALRQNFIDYSIKQHERSIDYADAGDVASVRYHESCIDKLKQGTCDYDFYPETGRKYHKMDPAVFIASLTNKLVRFISLHRGSLLLKVYVTICD